MPIRQRYEKNEKLGMKRKRAKKKLQYYGFFVYLHFEH